MERKPKSSKDPRQTSTPVSPSMAEVRRLIAIIEKSQIPFGESAPLFARIQSQVDAGKELSTEDYEHLLGLVKKAREWNKDVQSSAQTLPEETMSG